jgi:hypothetical protein
MKKLVFLFCCAVLSATVSFGQAEVAIGIKGGLNFANINGDQSLGATYNSRTGYHFGAYTLFKFGMVGIQPEVLFSKQGTKVTANTGNIDANFNYINIPVLLKLYTVAGLNLQVGPQIGFVTGGDVKTTVNGATSSTQNAKDFVNGTDWSIAMGIGWDIPFGLNLAARYNLGVSNNGLNTTSNNPNGSTSTFKNQVFQVSVGFNIIKIGK